MTELKPVVALTLGDAAGIGAELIARLLAEPGVGEQARIVLVADDWQWQQGQQLAGTDHQLPIVTRFAEAHEHQGPVLLKVDTLAPTQARYAEVSGACGASTLEILRLCLDAAQAGEVDAICFAPLNKHAMKLGGLQHEDELHFFAEYLGVEGYFCEFNTLGHLWTSRISSHVPLKDAAQYVTQERIVAASKLIHEALLLAGFESPRVAVAAFNPHAGEGGTCGREEIDVIAPAVAQCQAEGYPVSGPYPADTLFIRARDGDFDAVVTMYHDQGQIAIKLLGFSQGVTVQGGLPIPITTPAHGTAFDIAGQGKARVGPTRNAFDIACRMGLARRRRTLAATG
ncbi:4-hydroxythreonine-4-phosphate dehydrogenase PdxA [Zobellella taiwanensis]|uniref:4-hydroxythreonine-4-phosphate dehydrogenase n=1 Tax=Zobellella taiwanensis TaxID=347535 RepID=A0A2P7R1V6_9GAMM|nr:4-hydroxythreonine-4-phosphate dehydrogenase PdxA [Zobellella taiwanensis]PSJ44188.1 4-hydroxythreonine-4-phosphate dehydrogenase [Zobellella taiwanensis]